VPYLLPFNHTIRVARCRSLQPSVLALPHLSLLNDLPLGASEVGAEDELGGLVEEELGGGNNRTEAGVVSYCHLVRLVKGNVEVHWEGG